jgi:hypothetical protein
MRTSVAADSVILNSLAGTVNYEVPKSSVQLSSIFTILEENREELGLIDWGISNTSTSQPFAFLTSLTPLLN